MSDLGALRSRHRRTDGPFLAVYGFGLWGAATFAAVVAWLSRPLDDGEIATLIIAEVVMVPIGALAFWVRWLTRDDGVDIHEGGLLLHQHGFTRSVPWAEIRGKIHRDREHVTLELVDGGLLEVRGSGGERTLDETLDEYLK